MNARDGKCSDILRKNVNKVNKEGDQNLFLYSAIFCHSCGFFLVTSVISNFVKIAVQCLF